MKATTVLFLALITMRLPGFAQPVTWTLVEDAWYSFASAGSDVLGDYYYCFGGGVSSPIAQAFNLTSEQWEVSTHHLSDGIVLARQVPQMRFI